MCQECSNPRLSVLNISNRASHMGMSHRNGAGGTHAAEAAGIHARAARLTRLADPSHPLDTHTVTELNSRVLSARSHLHDLADALVAANLPGLRGERQGLPRVEHDAHI